MRAQTLHSPDQLWRCWKPFLRLLNVSEKCWKRENVFFRAYHTASGLTQGTLPFPVCYLFKLLRCECFWTHHILQIYQNTSVLNSSMPFPHLAMCWFYWERRWGGTWKRTCWRYARQVENERETRMYCKIPFCLDELKKEKKIRKRLHVHHCLPSDVTWSSHVDLTFCLFFFVPLFCHIFPACFYFIFMEEL